MNRLFGMLSLVVSEWALLLLLVIYCWNLNLPEVVSTREVLTLLVAHAFNHGGWPVHWLGLGQPVDWLYAPLFLWLLQFFDRLLGAHLWVERALAVLCMLPGIAGVYVLMIALKKNRFAALFAALTLATMWGFYRAAFLSGPDMLLLALIVPCMILILMMASSAGVSGSASARPARRSLQPLGLALGVALSLVFMAGGVGALLFVLLLALCVFSAMSSLAALSRVPWRWVLIPLAVIVLPWPLLLMIRYGVVDVLQAYAVHAFQIDFGRTLLFLDNVTNGLWPYILFLPACLFEPRLFRRGRGGVLDPLPALAVSWLVLGVLFSGTFHPAVMLLPPVALLLGDYFGNAMEGHVKPRLFGLAVDLTLVMLMIQAVAMSVLFYQTLPDEYPAGAWHLPGPAVISLMKGGMILALWKLWLIPLPMLLIIGGALLYMLSSSRRYQNVPFVLVGMTLLVMLFVRVIYWPVMQREVEARLSPALQKQWRPGDWVLADRTHPELLRMLVNLPLDPKRDHVMLFDGTDGLIRAMALSMTPDMESNVKRVPSIWGLVPEETYYKMDPDVRMHAQVVSARLEWHGLDVPAVTGAGLFMQRAPETMLLFRAFPMGVEAPLPGN